MDARPHSGSTHLCRWNVRDAKSIREFCFPCAWLVVGHSVIVWLYLGELRGSNPWLVVQ